MSSEDFKILLELVEPYKKKRKTSCNASSVLYNEYLSVSRQIQAREEWPQPAKYEGVAIPMNMDDDVVFEKMINKLINNKRGEFFQENFEIDDDRKYEKIDVPDFRDGRAGRFIHDFNTNITGIIDITGRR
nr:unnamed protein product [Callosobruchus analis]